MVAVHQEEVACQHCGQLMSSTRTDGRPRRFCSGVCSQRGKTGRKGGRPQKYFWTPELDKLLVRHYDGNYKTITWLTKRIGFPRITVRHRAMTLGLTRSKEPRWTPEDDDYLREHVTKRAWRDLAKHLGRTVCAVKLRAKRLGTNKTNGDETFTCRATAQILGVDDHKVQRWIQAGHLPATRRGTDRDGGQNGDLYRITPAALRAFSLRYPGEVDLRRVEGAGYKHTFIDIVAHERGAGPLGEDGWSRGSGDEGLA